MPDDFFASCFKLWQNRNTTSWRLGDIMAWCLKETHSSSAVTQRNKTKFKCKWEKGHIRTKRKEKRAAFY